MSYVKMPSDQAKKLAQSCLDNILSCRKEEKEYVVEYEVNRTNNGFFHKLFRLKDTTREETRKFLEEDKENYNAFYFIGYAYGRQEMVCKNILNACKYVSEINISIEDLRLIS